MEELFRVNSAKVDFWTILMFFEINVVVVAMQYLSSPLIKTLNNVDTITVDAKLLKKKCILLVFLLKMIIIVSLYMQHEVNVSYDDRLQMQSDCNEYNKYYYNSILDNIALIEQFLCYLASLLCVDLLYALTIGRY